MNWTDLDIPSKYRKLYEQGRAGKAKAAIRCHCLICVGWESAEVEKCTATGCPLFTLRNLAAQRATDAPNRARRRERALARGLRPPNSGSASGHSAQQHATISHAAVALARPPSPDAIQTPEGVIVTKVAHA